MEDFYIDISGIQYPAELKNTVTAHIIYDHLPFIGNIQCSVDKIYFDVPLSIPSEDSKKNVLHIGDIVFSSKESTIAILLEDITITSQERVAVFARMIGDLSVLRDIKDGEVIYFTK
ncbi:MAG: hypothetical protein HYV33_04680 [Candidatus Kerfeldbacteria bacterium]|nr:hypothetical protein [Candidatus Kerfeldbacteria bacterium]